MTFFFSTVRSGRRERIAEYCILAPSATFFEWAETKQQDIVTAPEFDDADFETFQFALDILLRYYAQD